MGDSIGMFEEESDDESFDAPNVEEMEDSDISDSEEEQPNTAELNKSILDQVRAKQENLKKRKASTEGSPSEKPAKKKRRVSDSDASPMKTESPKKPETPKKSETPKKEAKPETPKKDQKSPKQTRIQKLKGGTVAEILTPGTGSATSRKGQKVTVKYEGKLAKNGKKFDAGKFSFKLGKGEVIKGMDVGVEGMLLNEKRKITIPYSQAYGDQRTGEIPPKSDLEFVVTLLGMK